MKLKQLILCGAAIAAVSGAASAAEFKDGLLMQSKSNLDWADGTVANDADPLFDGGEIARWAGQTFPLSSVSHIDRIASKRAYLPASFTLTGYLRIAQPGTYSLKGVLDWPDRRKAEGNQYKVYDPEPWESVCSTSVEIGGSRVAGFDRAAYDVEGSRGPGQLAFEAADVSFDKAGGYPIRIDVGCMRGGQTARFERMERFDFLDKGAKGTLSDLTLDLRIKGPTDDGFRPFAKGELKHDAASTGVGSGGLSFRVLTADAMPSDAAVKPGWIVQQAELPPGFGEGGAVSAKAVATPMSLTGKHAVVGNGGFTLKPEQAVEAKANLVVRKPGAWTVAVEATHSGCTVKHFEGEENKRDLHFMRSCAPAVFGFEIGEDRRTMTVQPPHGGAEVWPLGADLQEGVYPLTFRAAVPKMKDAADTYGFRILVKGPGDNGLRPAAPDEIMYRVDEVPGAKKAAAGETAGGRGTAPTDPNAPVSLDAMK